jgi:hypothetical protein
VAGAEPQRPAIGCAAQSWKLFFFFFFFFLFLFLFFIFFWRAPGAFPDFTAASHSFVGESWFRVGFGPGLWGAYR